MPSALDITASGFDQVFGTDRGSDEALTPGSVYRADLAPKVPDGFHLAFYDEQRMGWPEGVIPELDDPGMTGRLGLSVRSNAGGGCLEGDFRIAFYSQRGPQGDETTWRLMCFSDGFRDLFNWMPHLLRAMADPANGSLNQEAFERLLLDLGFVDTSVLPRA